MRIVTIFILLMALSRLYAVENATVEIERVKVRVQNTKIYDSPKMKKEVGSVLRGQRLLFNPDGVKTSKTVPIYYNDFPAYISVRDVFAIENDSADFRIPNMRDKKSDLILKRYKGDEVARENMIKDLDTEREWLHFVDIMKLDFSYKYDTNSYDNRISSSSVESSGEIKHTLALEIRFRPSTAYGLRLAMAHSLSNRPMQGGKATLAKVNHAKDIALSFNLYSLSDRWTPFVATSLEEFTYLSRDKRVTNGTLGVARSSIYWIGGGLRYQTLLWKRPLILSMFGYKSLKGSTKIDDSSYNVATEGVKYGATLRKFFLKSYCIAIEGEYATLDDGFSINSLSYVASTGLLF